MTFLSHTHGLTRIVLAGALIAAAGLFASTADAELPEKRFVVIGGDTYNPMYRRVIEPFWGERIERASGGKFQVEVRAWNEMGLKGPEVLRLVRNGTYPLGASVLTYTSGDVKMNDGFDLGLMSPTLRDVTQVIEVFRPVFKEHYERELGLKVLAVWPLPPQVLYCRDELTKLADLEGRKVRVSGTTQAHVVQHFGGVDVNIAFGEMQSALQTGVVDCGITSATAGYSTGWHEVADYVYPIPINWQLYSFLVNLDTWNSFSTELQTFLQGHLNWLAMQLTEEAGRELNIGIACLTGNAECPEGEPGDMTLVEVTEEDEKNRIDALQQTVVPAWAKACGSACARKWNQTVGALLDLEAPTE